MRGHVPKSGSHGRIAALIAVCLAPCVLAAPADLRDWVGKNNAGGAAAGKNDYRVLSPTLAGGTFQSRHPDAFLSDASLSKGPFDFWDALSASGTITFSRSKATLDPEFFLGFYDSDNPRRRLGMGAADTPDAKTLRWQLQFDDGTKTVVANLTRGGAKSADANIPDGTYRFKFSYDGAGKIHASIGDYSTSAATTFVADDVFDRFGYLQWRENVADVFRVTISNINYTGQTDVEPRPNGEQAVPSGPIHGLDATDSPEPGKVAINFRRDVFPIFSQHCVRCHSDDEPNGSLKIQSRADLVTGGDSGPAIVPGNSGDSLLIQLVAGLDADRMMPAEGEPLSKQQIGVLRDWIDQDAIWDDVKEYRLPLSEVQLPKGDAHPIDRLLAPYFANRGVAPNGSLSDERFARRAALDLVGLPLTAEQLAEFLRDESTNKREKLVHRLLTDDENYAAHWMTFWSDHLRIGSAVDAGIFDGDGTKGPQEWLKGQLDENVPYDQFVRHLIAGEFFEPYAKSIAPIGEVASQVDRPEMQVAATISQVFLGIQLKCASCHDSFVDRWTMQDAWGLASALGDQSFDLYRCDVDTGDHAKPCFPLKGLGEIDPKNDAQQRRRRVAELMTHRHNGLFVRTIVNRLWARMMGRGLVEPLDEMMEHEPWNGELLDWLAAELIRSDYDLKHVLSLIATSSAYQRPAAARQQAASTDAYDFQGPEIRRLTAEQVIDSLALLQSAPAEGRNESKARAWQSASTPLMAMLGRPGREVVVTTRHEEVSTLLALELINGQSLETLVQQAAKAQRAGASPPPAPEEQISRIYQTLLCRDPSEREKAIATRLLGTTASQDALADLIWAVVMLPEFQLIP